MIIYKKYLIRILLSVSVVAIFIFQIKKRNIQIQHREAAKQSIEDANSIYAKLVYQRSVYSDSIYKIYIANVNGNKEIIFLKKDSLTNIQRQSKFFVHIYPKEKKNLLGSANHNAENFESNFISFTLNGQIYNTASTILPNYKIEKLNLGQYSFRGNNTINYRIKDLIKGQEIAKILKENGESMDIFEYIEETF